MAKHRKFAILFLIITVSTLSAAFFGCSNGNHFVTLYDGEEVLTTVLSDADGKVALPVPEKTGYIFDGWYTDSGLNNRFEPDSRIGSDTILYCGWTSYRYKVTLDAAGGNDLGSSEYECGSGIVMSFLPVPSREHYIFIGWLCDGEPVDVASPFEYAADVTFTAQWKPETFTVTYYGNGGIIIDGEGNELIGNYAEQLVDYGAPFVPYSAAKNGMTFAGWRTDNNENYIAPSVWTGDGNITLTAIYE